MKIGILGGGNVGSALGEGWARKGHDIVYGVRNPDAAAMQDVVRRSEGKACAGSPQEAVAFAEVILNALPWSACRETLMGLPLNGKVLLDASNPLKADLSLDLHEGESGGGQVSGWAKGARVVKIFNTTGAGNMANPIYEGKPIPMFYCGDDEQANKKAAGLAEEIGFHAVSFGGMGNARTLETLAYFWIWLAYPGGLGRDFAIQLVRR